jgi:hypothetical protein
VDPSGVFSIVNALRPVQPLGGTAKVLVAFNPQACCEYYEMLTLRCDVTARSHFYVLLREGCVMGDAARCGMSRVLLLLCEVSYPVV